MKRPLPVDAIKDLDGRIRLVWYDPKQTEAMISRDLLESLVAELNELRAGAK